MELLFPRKGSVTLYRLKDRSLYYTDAEGHPLLIDLDGKEDFYPTLYALWRVPNLLPRVYVPSPATKQLCRGADLMWPGTLMTREDREKGWKPREKRAVLAYGNPAAIAVGYTATPNPPSSPTGASVKILHVYGDFLWKAGGSGKPNEGFGNGLVHPLQQEDNAAEMEAAGEEEELDIEDGKDDDDGSAREGAEDESKDSLATVEEGKEETEGDDDDDDDVEKDILEDGETEISPEVMDGMIQEALLLALKFALPEKGLPMVAPQLFDLMVRVCVSTSFLCDQYDFRDHMFFLSFLYLSLSLFSVGIHECLSPQAGHGEILLEEMEKIPEGDHTERLGAL